MSPWNAKVAPRAFSLAIFFVVAGLFLSTTVSVNTVPSTDLGPGDEPITLFLDDALVYPAHLFYLHNNPTPPVGDTTSQAVLPLNLTSASATTLYNYDTDRDSDVGLVIVEGGSGAGETDPTKMQVWRTAALPDAEILDGTVTITLWAALKNYRQGKAGEVFVYLRDYNGATHTEIGSGTVFNSDWSGGSSTFVQAIVSIPGLNYTIPAGNLLEIKLIVGNGAFDSMWFAYDTTAYPTRVNLPSVDPIPPANPVNLVGTPGNTTAALDWDDNLELDLAGYNVHRSAISGGPYTKINASLVATSDYTDTGLTNGNTYYYVVTAEDGNGNESGNSNQVSVTPQPGAPAPPTGLTATAGNSQIALNWTDNTEPDLAGYNVYRHTSSGGPYTKINGSLVLTSDYTDTGLTSGTTYYYVVTAENISVQESGNSSEVNATPFTTLNTISVQDSRVLEKRPNENWGSNAQMDVVSRKNNRNERSFVEFDLSSIPSGATINSATLTLCTTVVPGATRTYNIHLVTAAWSENTVTWNNQPAVAATVSDSTTTPASPTCMSWMVTTDVQAWVDGTANNGWRVNDSVEGSNTTYTTNFRTSEDGAVPAERPTLVVVYTP